jgi:hypothetical protein
MTIAIEHSLKFVTEFDETHPSAKQFLALSELDQIQLLESVLHKFIVPALEPALDEINEHGTYAILKVVK